MIPVTSFAGKRVGVFGLGGSGLATARGAGGRRREVVGLGRQARRVAAAQAAGIPTVDLRAADWQSFAAWCLRPACR